MRRVLIGVLAAGTTLGQDIAQALDISRPTVQLWRERFLALRLACLEKDAPLSGRIPSLSPGKVRAVVEATLHTKPSDATPWSVMSVARAQGQNHGKTAAVGQVIYNSEEGRRNQKLAARGGCTRADATYRLTSHGV